MTSLTPKALALLFAIGIAFHAAPTMATILNCPSLGAMTDDAVAIVRGRVVEPKSAWDKAKRTIYTDAQVDILERMFEDKKLPDQVTVRTTGGIVGDVGMSISGEAYLKKGEEVVVFLGRDLSDPSKYRVICMALGKYSVERDESGKAVAVNNASGLAVAERGATGALSVAHAKDSKVPLEILRSRIQEALQSRVAPNSSGQ